MFFRNSIIRSFATRAREPLTILYGSQTGTTAGFAQTVGTFARTFNFDVTITPIDDFDFARLPHQPSRRTILLTSTCGTGELPRNVERFGEWLDNKKPDLSKLDYALFGLGNSNYDTFNFAAKELEKKLQDRGAKPFHATVYGDEAAPGGVQAKFQDWLMGLWGPWLSEGLSPALREEVTLKPTNAPATPLPDSLFPSGQVIGKVVTNGLATPSGAAGVMRLELDAPYQFLGYVSVQPKASPELVGRLMRRLGVAGDQRLEVTPAAGGGAAAYVATYAQLFGEVVDISAIPTRAFLVALAFSATDPKERTALEELGTDFAPGNRYSKLAQGGFWTLVDALEEFPSAAVNPQQLLSGLPPIQPRTYSVCSDPAVHPKQLDLVYAVVQPPVAPGRPQAQGLATGFLAALRPGDKLRCSVAPSTAAEIPASQSLVGVALGTGIAPFRAILQQRAALKARGQAVAPILLFFGFRTLKGHFLFESELKEYQRQGLVELVYTCSHDQPQMITPLDSIDAQRRAVIERLQSGAALLFCGGGGIFPKLLRTTVQQAADAVDAPADFVQTLLAERRYQEHFFSVDMDVENQMRALEEQRNARRPMSERFANVDMFCFQCEQTRDNVGCTTIGVCGKTPKTAAMQDLLVHGLKILGWYAHHARLADPTAPIPPEMGRFMVFGLFTCLTNVNFDAEVIRKSVAQCVDLTHEAERIYAAACAKANTAVQKPHAVPMPQGADLHPSRMPQLEQLGKLVGVLSNYKRGCSEDAAGLAEMLLYGLKGVAAYTDHAIVAGQEDPEVYASIAETLAFLLSPERYDVGTSLQMCLKLGGVNFKVMGNLYRSNALLGTPAPQKVVTTMVPGKCVLVSGHDLHVLKDLLVATEGTGINVYTHGEMLPSHGYPHLNQHSHLAGHFGGPWNRQSVEFPHFPGPVVMTTNCLTDPKPLYKHRLFTFGAVGWEGVAHLGNERKDVDWGRVVAAAQASEGIAAEDAGRPFRYPPQIGVNRPDHYTVGFGHEAILSHASTVLDEIRKGTISRFFVIGGCDGYEGARNYFTEVGGALPDTGVVLTMGCGKFRVNHLDRGTIGDTGIPRILDLGQCNDSHSAILVALALADALKCKVSDLPLSFVISWLEQKAVAVFLTMLHLGLKPIYLGPSLPAFATPAVLEVLVKEFGIIPAGDARADVAQMTKNDAQAHA